MNLTMHFNKFSKHLLFLIILNVFLQIQYTATEQTLVAAPSSEGSILKSTVAPQLQPSTPQRMTPPRIKLNKCCHYGEYLDTMRACVVGSSEQWVPIIFLINRKTYFLPKGESPKFITFEENALPIAILKNHTVQIEAVDDQQQQECTIDELQMFTGSSNLILFSNGSLFLRERFQFIEPRSYCIDRDAALVCFPKTTSRQPHIKVKKCCGKFGSYNETAKTCTENEHNLSLPLNETIYQTLYGFPECHEASTSYVIAGDWRDVQIDQATGYVQLHNKNLSTAEYCLEHLREGNLSKAVKIFACLHHFAADAPGNIAASDMATDHVQTAVLNFGIVISVVFLAATLIASYLMPSVHHVLHWRCQIYYVFSLFVADFIFAYTQLSHSIELNSFACLFYASATHFFFLSAFFWLNTMCFNIWWTFRDFRPSSLERNQELLRLRLYSAYAWGIPLVITVIAASVNQVPESQLLYPGFGERNCWFNGEHLAIFAYFYGPIGILLSANIILFVSTTHQLTCGLWKRDDVKSTTEKTALGKVCLKLVVVMGVTWIADIISWLVGGPHSVWFFTDLINALQGVFLFIVVGCQPQVWSACKRFCCPRSRQEITNTTNGVQHSSSSQGLPSMAACGAEITQNTSVNNTTISANNTQTKIPMETVC